MGETNAFPHVYCLFCRTGAEYAICSEIRRRFPGVYPLAATQEKHRIVNGHEELDLRVFLPGYLFLHASELLAFDVLRRMKFLGIVREIRLACFRLKMIR